MTVPTVESQLRKERPLDAPLLTFNLQDQLRQIKEEYPWREMEHNAITLFKGDELRIVLIVIKEKGIIQSHQTSHMFSLQVVEGEIRFTTNSGTVLLRKGELLTLHPDLRHQVEALEDSAFLLTMSNNGP